MPQELTSGDPTQTTSVPAPAAPTAAGDPGSQGGGGAISTAPPPASAPGSADAGLGTPPAAPQPGFREQLGQLGVDLTGLPDDRAAMQQIAQLYRAMPQLRQLAQVGEQVYPYLSQFQGWLAEQQQSQQRQQAEQSQWWKAPEYDPSWTSKITRDPATGQLVPVQGADPSILNKFMAFAEHRQNFLDKFAQDPIAAIRPGIEQVVQSLIAPVLQQTVQQQNEQRLAENLVAKNADWIYERDGEGAPVYDRYGRRQFSAWGERYAAYLQEAQQLGVVQTEQAHRYAMSLVERDFANAKVAALGQQQSAAQANVEQKQNFVNGARHSPNQGAQHAQGPNGAPARPGQLATQRDLADVLSARLAAAGYGAGKKAEHR